jgi:hypothetical protein
MRLNSSGEKAVTMQLAVGLSRKGLSPEAAVVAIRIRYSTFSNSYGWIQACLCVCVTSRDEWMADETDLVQVISEARNDIDVFELHIPVLAGNGIDEAVRTGAGTHDETAIGAR